MRLRLILSFVLIVLVSVAGVVIIARQGAASEIRSFMGAGMVRLDTLASDLEAYYQEHGSWQGAEVLLNMPGMAGHGAGQGAGQGMMGAGGMMSQGLVLADASGAVVVNYDTTNISAQLTCGM